MRSALTLLLLPFLAFPASASAATASGSPRIGPSFDCSKAKAPLAEMICASPALSKLDLRFAQAYWALPQQVGPAGQHELLLKAIAFQKSVLKACGIPEAGPVAGSPACVAAQYKRQRDIWLSRLSGPAAEEARRPIKEHIALQAKLQKLGFLPVGAKIDGVYGPATRAAILAWQGVNGRPETGFLSDADASILTVRVKPKTTGSASSKPVIPPTEIEPSAPPAAAHGAKTVWHWSAKKDGSPATYTFDNVKLTFLADKRNGETIPRLEASVLHGPSIEVSGTGQILGGGDATFRVLPLDPAHSKFDVVFATFSYGAHCCTLVKTLSLIGDEWKVVNLGNWDGDPDGLLTKSCYKQVCFG